MKVKRNLWALSNSKRTKRKQELIEIVKLTSLECGEALMELRDDEYWKDTHTNFKEFCEQTFNISGSYLYRLIEGHKIKESLPENLRKYIVSEKQARVLSRVPEASRALVVEKASKHGDPYPALLNEIAQDFIPVNGTEKSPRGDFPVSVKSESGSRSKSTSGTIPKVEPKRDWEKNIITEEAMPFWDRHTELWTEFQQLEKIIEKVEKAMAGKDVMYARVPPNIVERLKQDLLDLKLAEPYAICPACKGSPSVRTDGCATCGNVGMISKSEYDSSVR